MTINTTNVSDRYPCGAGEFVYECDDGSRHSTVKVKVHQKSIPGAEVFLCACAYIDENGTETDSRLGVHEISFMLGESDADPAVVMEALFQKRAELAHVARRQLDAIAALGLGDGTG